MKETKPEDYSKIVESINRISDLAKTMRSSGLSSEAVTVLIRYKTGLPMRDIQAVLTAAEDLKLWCLNAPK